MAWSGRAWRRTLAVAFLSGAATAPAGAGTGLALLTEQPLPITVRDGVVAEVTVREVPFPLGSATPAAPTAAALDGLVAAMATDCFLFAQAIGHVRPEAEAVGDTLAAHRLARTRSEAVGAALARAGIPAAAVTTVWDRQFTVREPRVTLWLFAQPPGDDCSGAPLPGAAPAVAVLRPTNRPDAAELPSRPGTGSMPLPPPGPPAVAATEPPPPPDLEPIRAAAWHGPTDPVPLPNEVSPAADPERIRADAILTAAAEGATARSENAAPVHAALPDPVPASFAGTVAKAVTQFATPPAHAALAEPGAGPASPVARPERTEVELRFAADSSDLDGPAQASLGALLQELAGSASWEIELQAAVADRAGTLPKARALAYNRWLAEQRQARVEEWLGTRGDGPVLRVRRTLLPHDPSRRIVLKARALSSRPGPHGSERVPETNLRRSRQAAPAGPASQLSAAGP